MRIKAQDIDIFVLTYNRCDYLKDSLISLFNQVENGLNITVIDNASTDNTPEYMQNICKEHSNVKYVRNEKNLGSEYSYKLAAELAEKPFMMCFHDDDLLHPKYIETALKYLNKYPDINILSTDCHTPDILTNENWEEINTKAVFCEDYKEFASYMYYEGVFAYPAVIYRTENVKNSKFEKKPFGKIDDKPRCVEISKGGSAVILQDKHFLRYRIHPGQDSSTTVNGPFYNEIINFNKYFKDILTEHFFSRNHILFMVRSCEWFEYLYNWGRDYTISLQKLVRNALKENACSYFTFFYFKKPYRFVVKRLKHVLKAHIKPKRQIVEV